MAGHLAEPVEDFSPLSGLIQCGVRRQSTPAKKGGDAVGYLGRKAAKTTNMLFICDKQGVLLAMSTPQTGEHHNLFAIKTLFDEICSF